MLPETLIGFSSKSYFSAAEADAWSERVGAALAEDPAGGDGVYACVPYPLLTRFVERLGPTGMRTGVQDVSIYPPGPYTGEVSAELLGGLGARYAMVGHPERRRYFGENDDIVRRKVAAAIGAGIVPILVCGEPTREDDPEPALRNQVETLLGGLDATAEVIVAYEPEWAIGQAQPAPPTHIARTVGILRAILAQSLRNFRIVYGGSAVPGTYEAIVAASNGPAEHPDGIFLGRGGLDPKRFLEAVAEVRAVRGLT